MPLTLGDTCTVAPIEHTTMIVGLSTSGGFTLRQSVGLDPACSVAVTLKLPLPGVAKTGATVPANKIASTQGLRALAQRDTAAGTLNMVLSVHFKYQQQNLRQRDSRN